MAAAAAMSAAERVVARMVRALVCIGSFRVRLGGYCQVAALYIHAARMRVRKRITALVVIARWATDPIREAVRA